MSWSIKVVGKKADVVAEVKRQLQGSKDVADFIVAHVEACWPPSPGGFQEAILVESWGHHGGGIGKLEITPMQLAPTAPVNPA
ncbi:MAG: hypothetical protein ABSD58_03175 [Verrucomicrobiia bacterium]|jgi:hypothetical protein